ncbi:MAG: DedA family protein [Patescibacteria group bacterium]|nr:DedA family protein [Patescibacteria group bacterium]
MVDLSSIKWLNDLTNLFITIGENHKYLNFFLGMLLESIGIPFASMPAFASTGYLLSEGQFNFWWAVIIGGLGNALGSTLSYLLGYFFGNVIRKRRKNHKLTEREDRLQEYIKKYGTKTIFFAQLFGFTRVFISLPAGLLKMDFKKFFLATFFGGMLFVIYFALGMMYLIDLYDKFVYPYIGLSFISLGILIGLGYALTHFSIHFGKKARAKYKEKQNGEDN